MNKKHISLAIAAVSIGALLAGCAGSFVEDVNPSALELAYVGTNEVKSAIDGTTFPTDGEIGLFLFTDGQASQPYSESGCENVEYSYNPTRKKWTASPSIKIGSAPGYLFGYYPYNSDNTDVRAIPVSSSVNGDDVMYATGQSVTDQTASRTSITMNHALARVVITVVNKGYTGDAKLSSIKFSGAGTAPTGTLDATDGGITATKSDIALEVPEESQTITSDGTVYDCLLVPSENDKDKQDVTLTLTIDGNPKTATLSGDNGVIIAQNTKSTVTITLSNSGISVQTVSVEKWNVVEVGGHKFTLKLSDDTGIEDDLIVQCKPESNSVKVEACSKTSAHLLIRTGDDTVIVPVENGNVSTFTISNITSDIEATLAYAKTYKVTGIIVPDVAPVEGYLDSLRFEGLGDYIEGRFTTVTVKITGSAPGYNCKEMVCDGKTVTGNTIVFEDVSKDLEVSARFEFYDYPLPGVFTVADDGEGNVRKVRFARGNMWYQNGALHNEAEQYQFSRADWEATGHISHFMWCKKLDDSVTKGYHSTPVRETDNFFTNTGSDHLSPNPNLVVNGQKGKWRILAETYPGEWYYLFKERTTTYGHRFAAVKVEGVSGLLLFPDVFSWPAGAGDPPAVFDAASSNWNDRNYKGSAFLALQDAGCVFLPAAGHRVGQDIGNKAISFPGSRGRYWSGTMDTKINLRALIFLDTSVDPISRNSVNEACSVRLVTDVVE